MSVGFPVSKAEIDNQAGSIARSVFNVLQTAKQFDAWLDTQTTEALEAYGYDSNDVAVLKSAFGDLTELASVFDGNAPLYTTAHNYKAFTGQLIGTGTF